MSGLVDFAEQELGLTLWPEQRSILDEYDRERPEIGVMRRGRRGCKTTDSAIIALHDATVEKYPGCLRPGERRYILFVATAERQALMAAMAAVKTLVAGSRSLRRLVTWESENQVDFSTGASIRVLPCSARSTRGLPASLVILDELAWFLDSEGYQSGEQVFRALAPSVSQFSGRGRILAASTPNGASGQFHVLCQQAANGDLGVREWHRTTQQMNPTISAAFLERERRRDPDSFSVEYLAEFGASIAAFLSPEAIARCVLQGVLEVPPREGVSYVFCSDPGFTRDAFALVGGCRVGDRVSIDLVRRWLGSRSAPVQLEAVLLETKELATRYNRAVLKTDQFAAVPIVQAAARLGLSVTAEAWTAESKLQAFGALKSAINSEAIALPDDPVLLGELRALQIRRGGQHPRIGAPNGEHDDLATALAAVVGALTLKHEPAGVSGDALELPSSRRESFGGLLHHRGVDGPLSRRLLV